MVAAVLLGGMGVMALLGFIYALMTRLIRREHDVHLPKPEAISVPFVMRFALGVYIIVLVYTVVRAWTRREPMPAGDSGGPARSRGLSVAVFGLIGLILVAMVWLTWRDRPSQHDSGAPANLVRAVRPAELIGLGYLPDDASMVLGFHAAEAVQEKASTPYLKELPPLEKWTGLKLADLDHVVAGLSLKKGMTQLTLVVETRHPYDLKQVEKGLQLNRKPEYAEKPLFSFRWLGWQQALLWCPGDHTLVIIANLQGSQVPNPKTVPLQPRAGVRKVPPLLQKLFRERPMNPGNLLWLAGHLDNAEALDVWHALVSQMLKDVQDVKMLDILAVAATLIAEKDQEAFARIRTFQMGVRLSEKLTLTGELRNPDPKGATRLARFLRGLKEIPVPQMGLQVKVDRDPIDNWVTFQIKTNHWKPSAKEPPEERP
jgi:hypothetical protein